ncbi:hypothetical protein ACIU4M_00525 [Bacillus altitudinis]|uniref:hypothetical protein n=1 Tax=Bacillus altitudinis TaxID=293387 RepID=UPI00389A3E4B
MNSTRVAIAGSITTQEQIAKMIKAEQYIQMNESVSDMVSLRKELTKFFENPTIHEDDWVSYYFDLVLSAIENRMDFLIIMVDDYSRSVYGWLTAMAWEKGVKVILLYTDEFINMGLLVDYCSHATLYGIKELKKYDFVDAPLITQININKIQ